MDTSYAACRTLALGISTLLLSSLVTTSLRADERPADPALLTVAESSDFRRTARHEEVVELSRRLAASSSLVHLDTLGTSHEGRTLPLLLVSSSGVKTPDDLRESGKALALVFGNIHAGEVCGKEALLMLGRELAASPEHPLLEELVIAIVPILNADGNERMSTTNRRNQVGPEEGCGERPNAQGLDLNRDWIKLEAPETRAIVRFMNRWDPLVVVDTHTTNGSYHRYGLTYAGPANPAGDAAVVTHVRDTLLPDVTRELAGRGVDLFFYGNFDRDKTVWSTYPDLPRYGTRYRGLRNRIAILSEAYSYSSYRQRVLDTREFVRGVLEHVAKNRAALAKLVAGADERTRAGKGTIALRSRQLETGSRTKVRGWVETEVDGKRKPTDRKRDWEVELRIEFEPTLEVERPLGYVVPATLRKVVDKLVEHGIEIHELRAGAELDLEVYTVESIERAEREFQGHRLVRVEAGSARVTRMVPGGGVFVDAKQKLGTLAAYLLEPEAADGLVAWNFLDEHLEVGAEYPITRVVDPAVAVVPKLRLPSPPEGGKLPLTFARVYETTPRPGLSGFTRGTPTWAPDGEHFVVRREGDWHLECADSGRSTPWWRAAELAAMFGGIPVIDEKTALSLARRLRLRTRDERVSSLLTHADDLYLVRVAGWPTSGAVRLTSTPDAEELPTLSPSHELVSFVQDNDLWVVDVATRTARALTSGGSETLRRGKASWVYFEEVFNRSWQAHWWSPDSGSIAFLETDSSPVKEFTLVDDLPNRQRVESSTYPKPGEPNPTVRVGIAGVAGGAPRWVDLSHYDPADMLVTGVSWTPDSSACVLFVQNRIQSWLDVLRVPRAGGKPTRLLRETSPAWVSQPIGPRFLADGTFVMTSERSGWQHLYHFQADGSLIRPLTGGEWEVRRVEEIVEHGDGDIARVSIWFSGTRDSHIATNLYRVDLSGEIKRLTHEPGSHRVRVAPGARFFVDTYSSVTRPGKMDLRDASGTRVRALDTNPVPDLERYVWCPTELLEIPARDGFPLPAAITRPPDFDASERYPVWFMTYAGPHAPTVRDAWSYRGLWEQTIAQSGIVVFRADPRSASGRGAVSAWSAYRQLGVQELRDIEDAIGWLAAHEWVDASRIGMSGHSYGGFMTAYAMTRTKLFAAGISGAPVTDWRDYDTIYTERYMQTPQLNPEGYERTSVVEAAGDLHGRLLLIHGFMDDNVHLQNTTKLIRALQRKNRAFELMLYPGLRHGIYGDHYRQLQWEFIQRTVGNGPRGGVTAAVKR